MAAWPVMQPLALGNYRTSGWSEDRGQCLTLLSHSLMGGAAFAVGEIGHPRHPPAFGAGAFDRFFRDALRSRSKTDNALNGEIGAAAHPLASSALLLMVAGSIGREAYADGATRALPLLWFGVLGNSLPTEIAKRTTGRKRPFLKFDNRRALEAFGNDDDARSSFYSGHASTAFFSAAFVDRVLADMARSVDSNYCLTCGSSWNGRLLRGVQALALYGLAAFVGYSRIEIDKHFMSDVLVGAFAGGLHGHLTFGSGYLRVERAGSVSVSALRGGHGIQLAWSF
jgi:membrane-associated phospholipid phosphatase